MNRALFSLALLVTLPMAAACNSDDSSGPQQDAGTDTGSQPTPDSGGGTPDTGIGPVDSGSKIDSSSSPDAGNDAGGDSGNAGDDGGSDGASGDDSGETQDASDDGDTGPKTLSFATDVYTPIIATHCIGCHSGSGSGVAGGHLDMGTSGTAFTDLVGVAAAGAACGTLGTGGLLRVASGDPDHSLLYNKVVSNGATLPDGGPEVLCGNPMPLHGAPLAAGDLATIHDWISQGANP